MKFSLSLLLIIIITPVLSGCTAPQSNRACTTGHALIQTQLYFGMNMPHGAVSEAEWQGFVGREIAPRFPEGFTVVDARGFWMGEQAKRVIAENSKLVVRIHAPTAAQDKSIEEIIADYKKEFAQESVLRVDAPVCAAF